MRKADPIRMSDYRQPRVIAFAPSEAARQFRISAILAGAIIVATLAVAAGTLSVQTHQAQAPAATLAVHRAS